MATVAFGSAVPMPTTCPVRTALVDVSISTGCRIAPEVATGEGKLAGIEDLKFGHEAQRG